MHYMTLQFRVLSTVLLEAVSRKERKNQKKGVQPQFRGTIAIKEKEDYILLQANE